MESRDLGTHKQKGRVERCQAANGVTVYWVNNM